jgi:peroxiredoxin
VALIDSKLKNIDSLDKRWVIENKSSSAGAIALQSLIGRMSMDELEAYYHTLTPSARNNTMADKVIDAVNASRSLKTGNMAPDFTNKNILGEPVSLSSFKGKYVLLDFWASWCGPCRKGHPNLKKAYEQFKGKNFDILSVSLDDDRERWMDAIKKDGLTWTQVSDLNAWSNIATRKFMIQGIPTNFLISPEGKIIARDLHGEELLRKLETIF